MKKITAITLFGLAGASFALQGGPTQPDYIEFEPSEMKDMVSLTSGNFAYSIPLGEVPGAYGSYPLSLSYHAGISPQQEASWVGLGWTLSPGSIVRDVRGVPDDQFHGGTLGYVYQYSAMYTWSIDLSYSNGPFSVGMNASSTGGVGASFTLGYKVAEAAEVGFTVSTNRGIGISGKVGFGDGASLNASAMFYPGTGDWTFSAGVGAMGENGIGASAGVQYTTGQGAAAYAGMAVKSKNMENAMNVIGASVRKNGASASLGPVTASVASSTAKGSSKTSSTGFAIVVPTNVGVFSLGFSQSLHEYHMRAATSDYVYGYMYQGGPAIVVDGDNSVDHIPGAHTGSGQSTGRIPWKWTFKGRTLETLGDEKMQPAYDMYTIESEGVSGTFRAFPREEHQMLSLISNREKEDKKTVEYYNPILELDSKHWPETEDFDYVDKNDLNNLSRKASQYPSYKANNGVNSVFADYKTTFRNEGNRMVYRKNKDSDEPLTSGLNFLFLGEGGYYASEKTGAAKGRPAGSVSEELLKRTIGETEYALYGSRKVEPIFDDESPVSKIKGFVITNSNGTKYFFTQPVRSYLKVDYTINQEKGTPAFIDYKMSKYKGFWDNFWEGAKTLLWPPKMFEGIRKAMQGHLDEACKADESDETQLYSYQINMNPHATQWLLTEIQGPDYIQLDKEKNDISKTLGYNVRFSYTDPILYQWRSPYAQPHAMSTDLPNFRVQRNGLTPLGCDTKMYQASFGVKEYVYLKSIETATHKVDFILNDTQKEERVDGKGWYFDKKDRNGKKYLPILSTTALALKVNSVKSEKIDNIQIENDFLRPANNWHEASFVYDALYINVEIPKTLQEELKNNPELTLESDYGKKMIHIGDGNSVLLLRNNFVIEIDNTEKDIIEKTSGEEARYGLYKIKLKKGTEIPFYWQSSSQDQDLFNEASIGNVKMVLGDMGHGYIVTDDDKITSNENDKYKIYQCNLNHNFFSGNNAGGYGGGSPYWTWSTCSGNKNSDENNLIPPFIDWADIVFAGDQNGSMNQGRYLKKVSYFNKKESKAYREFIFDYDYSLHPRTLNSYCKARYPKNLEDIQNSPLNAETDVCSKNTKSSNLYGKLTLKAISEKGCQNGRCTSLPPFKFDYNVAAQTSTRYSAKDAWAELSEQNTPKVIATPTSSSSNGEASSESSSSLQLKEKFYTEDYYGNLTDIDASILASEYTIDEWGFWNNHGNEDNRKVNQSFADYGAAAWSLNKITDPAGGVLEVKYERDSYKNGEDHSNEKLYASMFRIDQCSRIKDDFDFSKDIDPQYNNHACALFLPMYWKDQCLGPRTAYWSYIKPKGYAGGDFDYMDEIGIVKDKKINSDTTVYFNARSELKTEVDCGVFGLADCDRFRDVGILGSTNFLAMYEGQSTIGSADLPYELKKGYFTNGVFHATDNEKWLTRVLVLGKDNDMILAGLQRAADKINNKQYWDVSDVSGKMWPKQEYASIKGGDLRVKSLVRHDIDRTTKTEYEYEPGEMAQLPDSAYTTVLGNRFNASIMSFALPDLNMKSKSRIVGFEDDDLLYVPGATIMYPKVTVKNSDNDEKVTNGKIEYEYITPETGVPAEYIDSDTKNALRPFIRVNANMLVLNKGLASYIFDLFLGNKPSLDAQEVMNKVAPYVLRFEFLNKNKQRIGDRMKILLQQDKFTSFSFYDENVRNVAYIKVTYKKADGNYIDVGTLDVGNLTDFNEVTLTVTHLDDGWNVYKNWQRSQKFGYYPILYKKVVYKDMTLDDVVRNATVRVEDSITYHDFTAFLGMNTKTTFYRGNDDKAILLRVDSNAYATKVPDILPNIAEGKDIESKIGVQLERWKSIRELQCNGNDDCKSGQWSLAARKQKTENGVSFYEDTISFAYKRYPAFLIKSMTSTGFDNQEKQFDANSSSSGVISSSSCDNRCQENNKRRMTTWTENHRYDPVTSNPTATVAKIPSFNGKEIRKLSVKIPHHAVQIPSSSSASEMAAYMFKKNMLSQNFADFVYSDSTPIDKNAAWNNLEKVKYLKGFSMKPMKKYNGNLTYTDNSQMESDKYPYIEWGTFTTKDTPKNIGSLKNKLDSQHEPYRFVAEYQNIESSSSMNWPDKNQFSGNHILAVDQYYRPTEVEDIQGRVISSHYTEDGLHQTGLFFPANRNQTASIVPVGNEIVSVNVDNTVTENLKVETKKGEMVAQSTITLKASSFNCSGELVVEYRVKKSGKKWQTKREKLSDMTLTLNKGEILNYLRVYPDNAEAKTYLYDVYGNILQIVDTDNLSTYYEYNPLGQLIQTRNDDGVSFKSHHREFMNDNRNEIPWTHNNSSSSSN